MMKNIKRFQIDVETAFGGNEYQDSYPLEITDLQSDYLDAMDGLPVAEIEINEDEDNTASFRLSLDHIEALFDVLTHIRNKVLEQKPKGEIQEEKN